MMGRPTYKEYRQSQKTDNMIMTADGSLYVISNPWIFKFFVIFISVLLTSTMFLINRSDFGLWPNLMAEWFILFSVVIMLVEYPKYRLMRFVKLDPDSQDYTNAASNFEPQQEKQMATKKGLRIIGSIMLVAWFVFLLLNSHTTEIVRSLFDSPRLVSMEVTDTQGSGDDEVLFSADDDTSQNIIPFPAEEQRRCYAEIHVSRTLTLAHITLDGQPLSNYYSSDKQLSWFWEPEYLNQRFFLYLGYVRDGSTLTLTCGDLVREWVFDVADEEAS